MHQLQHSSAVTVPLAENHRGRTEIRGALESIVFTSDPPRFSAALRQDQPMKSPVTAAKTMAANAAVVVAKPPPNELELRCVGSWALALGAAGVVGGSARRAASDIAPVGGGDAPPTSSASSSSSGSSSFQSGYMSLISDLPPMGVKKTVDDIMKECHLIPPERIRNFAIVAHIDHGKTTLSDAILRRTHVLDEGRAVGQYMDKLLVEKERGITIKAQTCSIFVRYQGVEYMLNLIDTPGHVDFTYEVSRSLHASEGAVLLVDATQGVEAQTMANYLLALEANLVIVPALSKLDAVIDDGALDKLVESLPGSLGVGLSDLVLTAAKAKRGIEDLLIAIIKKVPPPRPMLLAPPSTVAATTSPTAAAARGPSNQKFGGGEVSPSFRGLLFDAWVRGDAGSSSAGAAPPEFVCLIRVMDGRVKAKDTVAFFHSRKPFVVRRVGIMYPEPVTTTDLHVGQVGFVELEGLVTRTDAAIGDTLCSTLLNIEPIKGFKISKPVVFAGFFPDGDEMFEPMRRAVQNLMVNEPSVTCTEMTDPAFGPGLQLGFLGMLHKTVFQERLLNEFGRAVLVTPAQVAFKYEDGKGEVHDLSVFAWKDRSDGVAKYLEPIVRASIVCPVEMVAEIDREATVHFRAMLKDNTEIDRKRTCLRYHFPLLELVAGFFDRLKTISHGYATLEYDDATYEEADLVKIDVQVNKAQITSLSCICVRQQAPQIARRICQSLRDNLERSVIDLPIQAFIGGKCIARETVGSLKKDVCAKIHAGDISRKRKKLEHQKEGKKRLAKRLVGSVSIDQETLAAALGATRHD
mgnify:CR=1 FL=1